MTQWLALSPWEFSLLASFLVLAGMVRGFSGFGLSAVGMVCGVFILPPIQLIPMFWFLEMGSSLVMLRGGARDADMRLSITLVIGAGIGLPLGLLMTMAMPEDLSRLVALVLICALAAAQLLGLRLIVFANQTGYLFAGLCAGMATGIASCGGLLIALFVLALSLPPRTIRASLTIYLMGGGLLGLITHLAFGTMDQITALRGLVFLAPTLLGIWIGSRLFVPRFEPYYRPFCLALVIGLSLVGIIRMAVA